jgi:predicted PurR-regulated permease PerM
MNRERLFLLVLVVAFAVLTALLLAPFLQYVLAAVVLAYVLQPVHRWLAPRVGPRVAAVVLMSAAVLVVVGPLLVVLSTVLGEARRVVMAARTAFEGTTPLEEQFGVDLTPSDFLGSSNGEGSAIVGGVLDVLGGVTDVLVGLVVMAFLLYYLLTAGGSLHRWTRHVLPLSADVQDELYERIDDLLWAVVVVNVAIAVVQGVLTGLGLWVVGFTSVVFWTVLTAAVSLLPFVGAPVVWGPAAAYLLLVGRPVAAVGLALWGTAVVGLSDDYLRPVLGGREAELNPGLFVIGIFGGVAVFGPMGVFFGPVVLGVLKALVEVYVREQPGPATPSS